jgi:cob(I)alamin adenosyltransferase
MDETLEKLTQFIIPGGHVVVSYSHICRSICRRAERVVVHLNKQSQLDENVIQFLNRLSDYFFILARWTGKKHKS